MGLASDRTGGTAPTAGTSSASPTTSNQSRPSGQSLSTQQTTKSELRTTEGFDAQSKLLEPKRDGSGAGGDGVLEEADRRLSGVKRNLAAELQAERLATLYDMPGKQTQQKNQTSTNGQSGPGPLDIAALVKRWNAEGVKVPSGRDNQQQDGTGEQDKNKKSSTPGDATPAWNALLSKSPTIEIASRKGSHRSPFGQGSEESIKALLERLVFYMGLDDQRIGLELGDAMKEDGVEKGSEKTASSHQPQQGWEAKAEEEDPAWWENLLAAMGGAFAFAVYDYIAFNAFAFGQGDGKQLRYRLFQTPTQLFIHRWLSQHVSGPAAAAFDIIWWTWGCDLLFYALAEMGFGDGHSGTFETVAKGDITWASWTPLGIVAGIGNLLNGKKWTEPLDGTMLVVQSVIGFLVAAGVSFMSRSDWKSFTRAVGLDWLESWFQKNGMDLYVEVTTSLANPKLEGGIVYQPDEQTELHVGLGVDNERGPYGTMGIQYLSEHRDWLLRAGLEIDKQDLRLYAAWQKKVADWNLFVETQIGDELVKLGGGAELRGDGTRLSGKVSWDSKQQWLASLRISVDL